MEEIIKLEHVGKYFGEVKVLGNLTFSCHSSEILGIVGRNGSGKTVLFKCICGLFPVSEGEIRIRGKLLGKDVDIPEKMGVLIENPAFLPEFNAYDNLRILARINREVKNDEVKEILEKFGLDWKNRKKVGKYSMGMRQRLGLAQAVMENPDILILDEPMNGLDTHWIEVTRNMLLAMKEEGKTILLASHNREDLDILCDGMIQLKDGEIMQIPSLCNELKEKF
ncbi:MAG: ATP-binding cassette domain-containing protein [Roseburia sp.]|nr:ATP-binding cassette domain-containing protein [Roseburia sp.]